MGKISYNSLVVDKVFAETVKTNDDVKYLDEDESIAKYGSGETILPYDWSPDYSNAFQLFGVSGYTAQTSGWLSVDGAERDVTSIFINGAIANTFYNDGSYQVFLTRGDSVTASSKIDITFAPSISESSELPVPLTEYDIWGGIPFVSDDGVMLLKNMFIPNASYWNSKIYKPNNLTITKVENDKAYNGDKFVCNIQSEKIENGSRLFFNCRELVTFNSDLSSLSNGRLMFFNCNLDATSVERILTTIPTYISGVHELTMNIQDSAVGKFSEIVGVEITSRISIVEFKGWTITLLRKDEREIPTDYDIWKNVVTVTNDMQIIIKNLYIPDASKWNSEIYQKNNLNITSVENDKAYNGNNFVCNIQSGNIENGSDLFKNAYDLTSFSNNLSKLKTGNRMFLNSGLTDFSVELSSLTDAKNMFVGCPLSATSIETILNSLPTYTSGSHEIGLTLMTETEANKFSEITGVTIEQGQIYTVSYKGWNIKTYLSKDDRETQTNYDIWENVIVYDSKTDEIGVVDLYLPDASAWKSEVYDNARLRITSVEDNKAYNSGKFVCNIKTDKIVNGDGLFYDVSSLSTFTSPLTSLSSGDGMFSGCNLDVASVENILGTIPTYSSGEHVLTMKTSKEAAIRFSEITGCGEIGEEDVLVNYKGWSITIMGIPAREETDFDIWEGTPYIPNASAWRTDIYEKHPIKITEVRDNKMFNGDKFVANIQCEKIEKDYDIEADIGIPIFYQTHLENFSGDLSSLKNAMMTFGESHLKSFSGNLSGLKYTPVGLFHLCYDLTEFDCDLSNLIYSEMPLYAEMLGYGYFTKCGLKSFDKNLSSLVTSSMFLDCEELENFSSDISSLGDYSKIYENPDAIGELNNFFESFGLGWQLPESYPPTTEEELSVWNSQEMMFLLTGNLMFAGCNLNVTSVEHILNSLSSYNDGIVRYFAMTINPSAASTFERITGAVFGGGTEVTTQYKGWIIVCQLKEQIIPTELDALKGSQYLDELPMMGDEDYEPYYSVLNSKLNELLASKLEISNNKIYAVMSDSTKHFIGNIDCEWMISSVLLGFYLKLMGGISLTINDCQFPRLKYNYAGLPLVSGGDYRSLVIDLQISGSTTSSFYENLHSLVMSSGSFAGSGLSSFSSDLRSLNVGVHMFEDSSKLTTFNSKLFSLGDAESFYDAMYDFYYQIVPEDEMPTKEELIASGEIDPQGFATNMFTGCKLDAPSVENILTTIPAYDDGIYRELGMTIQSGEAAAKFGEITGIIPASTEEVEVPFKGWNVKVNLFSV